LAIRRFDNVDKNEIDKNDVGCSIYVESSLIVFVCVFLSEL